MGGALREGHALPPFFWGGGGLIDQASVQLPDSSMFKIVLFLDFISVLGAGAASTVFCFVFFFLKSRMKENVIFTTFFFTFTVLILEFVKKVCLEIRLENADLTVWEGDLLICFF